jgi:hypothetical protein
LFIDDTSFAALILEHAANLVVSLVTTPFVAAVTTLVYFDLRVRKEGFDPVLPGEGMGGPTVAGPPAPPSAPSVPPPLWSSEREGERDAFDRPVAPGGERPPYAPPTAPAPPDASERPAPAPGSWAPPVAPEPKRPPSQDE